MRTPFPPGESSNPVIGVVTEARHYRECLVQALKVQRGFAVRDLGGGGPESLKRLVQDRHDLALVDLRPANLEPFVRRAHIELPKLLLIAVGVREDEKDLLALFEVGMAGFVPLGSSLEDVFGTIRAALRGELHCPPQVVAALARRLGEMGKRRTRHQGAAHLTPREEQVLKLLGEGLTNKEIATRLTVEASTIKNHVHAILNKLSVEKRSEIAAAVGAGSRPRIIRLRTRVRGREEGV
jgi:two-component system nitrate/nitrite response regulator NarL